MDDHCTKLKREIIATLQETTLDVETAAFLAKVIDHRVSEDVGRLVLMLIKTNPTTKQTNLIREILANRNSSN